jgi:hypothetical protein
MGPLAAPRLSSVQKRRSARRERGYVIISSEAMSARSLCRGRSALRRIPLKPGPGMAYPSRRKPTASAHRGPPTEVGVILSQPCHSRPAPPSALTSDGLFPLGWCAGMRYRRTSGRLSCARDVVVVRRR